MRSKAIWGKAPRLKTLNQGTILLSARVKPVREAKDMHDDVWIATGVPESACTTWASYRRSKNRLACALDLSIIRYLPTPLG